jgi:shikimate dehydrogenase
MRAAVLGKPIAHSLSPVLHRAAHDALGLGDWEYETVECGEEELPGFVTSRNETWAGLSLTMPLKRAVLPLLDQADPLATATGGANTVVFRAEGLAGYNTDVQGIVAALTEAGLTEAGLTEAGLTEGGLAEAGTPSAGPPFAGRALILGAGATACSALAAIGAMGGSGADVAVRDKSRATGLLEAAERLALRVRLLDLAELDRASQEGREYRGSASREGHAPDLLISTLPAGAADFYRHFFAERPSQSPPAPATVFDVVYAPWPTQLALAARAAGTRVVGGFPMLLHQAAAQVELMTGKPAPLEAMRAAGEAELARRAAPAP